MCRRGMCRRGCVGGGGCRRGVCRRGGVGGGV